MTVSSLALTKKVFKIAGSRPGSIGTGFAIHRDDKYLYIVTCRHVIDQVGEESLTVEAKPPRLLCSIQNRALIGSTLR